MKKIIIWVLIVLVIGGLAFILIKKTKAPGKYDQFAQCLADKGLKFYGAFWCPHCQKQKAEFGKSVTFLPYIECSNTDGSQNTTCNDKQVEGYPTWEYSSAFTIKSSTPPSICNPVPNNTNDPAVCKQIGTLKSHKEWLFADATIPPIQTTQDPVIKDGSWTFPAGSRSVGETSLKFLAEQSSCVLPQ